MLHLHGTSFVPTLGIETFVLVGTVQDAFAASDVLGDGRQSMDQMLAELFALVGFGNRDILNVAAGSQIPDASKGRSQFHVWLARRRNETYNLRSTIRTAVPTIRFSCSMTTL